MVTDLDAIRNLLPEVILAVMASWIYLAGTLTRGRAWLTTWSLAAAYGISAAAIMVEGTWWGGEFLAGSLNGPLVVDPLGYFLRWMVLVLGLLFTLIATHTAPRSLGNEVHATVMLLVVGLMLVARANDMVLWFVGLELISIPTYVLLYLGRRDRATAEAAAKYFFLSILSSGMLLYGLSFLYGLSGSTQLLGGAGTAVMDVGRSIAQPDAAAVLATLALVLILAGLGFKIAAVPFHFYAPDVYQGASSANAALLATAPKIAGVIGIIRVLVVAFPQGADLGWQLAMILSMLTMTLGNVCALWQHNVRRLMAFSSIAHAGYMLIGLSVGFASVAGGGGDYGGVTATLTYLVVYVVATLGAFAAFASLGDDRQELNDIASLAGLASTKPVVAAALATCMFSLAGIPPLAGFWGKLTLFGSALQVASATGNAVSGWFTVLAVVGVINAAIAAAYYLRIVAVMYFWPAAGGGHTRTAWGPGAAMVFCAVLLIAIGALPRLTLRATRLSAAGLAASSQARSIGWEAARSIPERLVRHHGR